LECRGGRWRAAVATAHNVVNRAREFDSGPTGQVEVGVEFQG